MDDGDDRYHRETTAAEGPVKYVDLLDPEVQRRISQGEATVPYNEYFRVRTRTGHQILLHNSEDLIYIGNARGTAWIEMTSNGKIDIYAADSVSIHSEQDFNFRADRDINIEAGRNIHVRAGKNMETNITGYNYLTVDQDQKISVRGTHDETIGGLTKISVANSYNLNIANDINYRSFETIGCGTVLLTNYNPQYLELGFKDNINCLMYKDTTELVEKIQYVKNNDLSDISNNGYELSKNHSYKERVKLLFSI
jgi:hypothetical protein